MENTKNQQATQLVQDSSQILKRNKIPQFLITLLFLLAIGGLIYLKYQNYQLKSLLSAQKEQSIPGKETVISPSPSLEITKWKTTAFGGLFSYEYPEGWHVGEIWSDNNNNNAVVIRIDPNPISTAPRGGPFATIEIEVINGLQNPNEEFEKRKAEFNKQSYTDISTKVITSDLGPIYYYKGKIIGPMFEGEPVETYYLTFETAINNSFNQQIIIATTVLNNDPAISEILKHIVLNIKKLH